MFSPAAVTSPPVTQEEGAGDWLSRTVSAVASQGMGKEEHPLDRVAEQKGGSLTLVLSSSGDWCSFLFMCDLAPQSSVAAMSVASAPPSPPISVVTLEICSALSDARLAPRALHLARLYAALSRCGFRLLAQYEGRMSPMTRDQKQPFLLLELSSGTCTLEQLIHVIQSGTPYKSTDAKSYSMNDKAWGHVITEGGLVVAQMQTA